MWLSYLVKNNERERKRVSKNKKWLEYLYICLIYLDKWTRYSDKWIRYLDNWTGYLNKKMIISYGLYRESCCMGKYVENFFGDEDLGDKKNSLLKIENLIHNKFW
jgi:hypothetical protein